MRRTIPAPARLGFAVLGALAVPFPAIAATIVVDASGGGDHLDLPPAIAAAAPGDTIVVRNGTYSPFVLDKGLTILAGSGDAPVVGGDAEIRDLPSGAEVRVASLTFHRLDLESSAGSIHLDACTLGLDSQLDVLEIDSCHRVTLSRCVVDPDTMVVSGFNAGTTITDSFVVASECSFRGASAFYDIFDLGPNGSHAVVADGSVVYLFASSLRGGDAGDSDSFKNGPVPGNGGDGLRASNSSSVHVHGMGGHVVRGGDPGVADAFYVGNPGDSIDLDATSRVEVSGVTLRGGVDAGPGRGFEFVRPRVPVLRLGGSGLLGDQISPTLRAPIGSRYLLFVGFGPEFAASSIETDRFVDPSGASLLASGTTVVVDTAHPIPLGPSLALSAGAPFHFQALVLDPSGRLSWSTAASFVLR
ncbi:MAG: hypothetical protein ACF8XB_19720 [Planctomycetota bacterium JB042]